VNAELRALEAKLEQQKNAEQQENLRRIQAQMEADRQKRQEEERRRLEDEAQRLKFVFPYSVFKRRDELRQQWFSSQITDRIVVFLRSLFQEQILPNN
jgi:hypothetical protein